MGIKVLFIYPNTYGMNMLPPAIALFSAMLKKQGHEIKIWHQDVHHYPDEQLTDYLDNNKFFNAYEITTVSTHIFFNNKR